MATLGSSRSLSANLGHALAKSPSFTSRRPSVNSASAAAAFALSACAMLEYAMHAVKADPRGEPHPQRPSRRSHESATSSAARESRHRALTRRWPARRDGSHLRGCRDHAVRLFWRMRRGREGRGGRVGDRGAFGDRGGSRRGDRRRRGGRLGPGAGSAAIGAGLETIFAGPGSASADRFPCTMKPRTLRPTTATATAPAIPWTCSRSRPPSHRSSSPQRASPREAAHPESLTPSPRRDGRAFRQARRRRGRRLARRRIGPSLQDRARVLREEARGRGGEVAERDREIRYVGEALRRILLQAPIDHRAEPGRHVGALERHGGVRVLHHFERQLRHRLGFERRVAGQHHVEHDAERPDVAPGVRVRAERICSGAMYIGEPMTAPCG